MVARRTFALSVTVLLVAASCSSGSDSITLAPVDEAPTTPAVDEPTEAAPPDEVDTSLGDGDTGLAPVDPPPATDAPPPETTTTTIAPAEVSDVSWALPAGPYSVSDGDLFVLRADGDLELHEQVLDGSADSVTRVVDNVDPRDAVDEGPGPNVVDDVAGVVNGAIVYSECCEPVSGAIFAAGDDDDSVDIGFGFDPVLSPDGTRIAAANDQFFSIVGVDGVGSGVPLNQAPGAALRSVFDVEWIDDSTVALLRTEADLFSITTHDATSLVETASVTIEGADQAIGVSVDFAGLSEAGELVVTVQDPIQTTLRYLDPATLTETDTEPVVLPVTVSAVQVGAAGVLWVDGGTLFLLPVGEFVAVPLADDVLAAWFAETALASAAS